MCFRHSSQATNGTLSMHARESLCVTLSAFCMLLGRLLTPHAHQGSLMRSRQSSQATNGRLGVHARESLCVTQSCSPSWPAISRGIPG